MLRINEIAPNFEAETTIGKSIFITGHQTPGLFFFLIQKISPQFVQLSWVIWLKLKKSLPVETVNS